MNEPLFNVPIANPCGRDPSHSEGLRGAWALLGVILILDLLKAATFVESGPAPVVSDAAGYWSLAQQVAGGDLWMQERPIASRTPVYPSYLGICRAVAGANGWRLAIGMQAILLPLTSWAGFAIVRKAGGGQRLAILAAAWSALCLARASYVSVLLTETLFTFVLSLFVVALLAYQDRPTIRLGILVGMLWGLASLIRPIGVVLAPAVFAAGFVSTHGMKARWRLVAQRMAVCIGTAALIVTPWCVRNAVLFGRPTLTCFLGRELWLATFGAGTPAGAVLPESPSVLDVRRRIASQDDTTVDWTNNWSVSNGLSKTGLNDAEVDDLMLRASREGISADPLRFLGRVAMRQIDYWRAVYSSEQALYQSDSPGVPQGQNSWGSASLNRMTTQLIPLSPSRRLLVVEVVSLLALAGLAGMLVDPQFRSAGVILTAVVLSIAFVTAALELPNYRYRMVLEPCLIAATLIGGRTWLRIGRLGIQALAREREAGQGRSDAR